MSKSAIKAGKPAAASAPSTAIQKAPAVPPTPPRPARAPRSAVVRVLERVADLRITVTLFALSLFLVFYGTLAQVDKGIWIVVGEYFRSAVVWIPLKIVFFRAAEVPGAIPFPGGWLLGGLLLVNLLAAHIVSFKLSWKRSGILLIHAGIVIMMFGELVTGLFAVESHMSILEGQSSNFLERQDRPELAVVDASDVKQDHVTAISTDRLRKGGLIQDTNLPFDVEVVHYWVNSRLVDTKPGADNLATRGQGLNLAAQERPEGVGVDTEQKVDIASMYATLKRKGTGESLGTYLFTPHLAQPEWVEVDGKWYQVSLRSQRNYKDYTFHLDKLNVEFYPGTQKPKDYSSFIHLTDPAQKEDRDVRIYMNHPLTYAGATFYQIGVHQERGVPATTLQVVRNPGWMMPYLSCLLVACGMLVHFGQNLARFLERRAA
jgi:hypothetical protein